MAYTRGNRIHNTRLHVAHETPRARADVISVTDRATFLPLGGLEKTRPSARIANFFLYRTIDRSDVARRPSLPLISIHSIVMVLLVFFFPFPPQTEALRERAANGVALARRTRTRRTQCMNLSPSPPAGILTF